MLIGCHTMVHLHTYLHTTFADSRARSHRLHERAELAILLSKPAGIIEIRSGDRERSCTARLARSRRGGCSAARRTSPPPVGRMCRAVTLATRDEPARFGRLQITLCARAALVGSPGSAPARGAISCDLAVAVYRIQRRAARTMSSAMTTKSSESGI